MNPIKFLSYNYPFRFFLSLLAIFLISIWFFQPQEQIDNRGRSLLYLAAELGDYDEVKNLIYKKALIDQRDNCLWTPLMRAAQNGHLKVVELLIDNNANINAVDKAGYSVIMVAAGDGQNDIVKLLIKAGALLNKQDNAMGWTALIWTIKGKYQHTAITLINAGANLFIKDGSGKTAKYWAEKLKLKKVLLVLENKGSIQ